MDFYTLEICGLTRKLPLIQIGRNTKIASFSILGDVELVSRLADEITKKAKKYTFDYIVAPEVKAVPLVHEVAQRLKHKRFVICRKSIKPHMISPVVLKPLSHFPKHVKALVLSGDDAKILNGKKVLIIDDVVSTGVTVRMMEKLIEDVNGTVVGVIAAIKQGEQFDIIKNFEYLAELPIFKKI